MICEPGHIQTSVIILFICVSFLFYCLNHANFASHTHCHANLQFFGSIIYYFVNIHLQVLLHMNTFHFDHYKYDYFVLLAHYEIELPPILTEAEIFISSWLHENWSLKHTNKSIWCKLEIEKFKEIYLNGQKIKT